MKQTSNAIRKDLCSADLPEALAALADEAERITHAYRLRYDELADIARSLADIRSLLDELARSEAAAAGAEGPSAAGRLFAERYRDLEGRVKEMRNDSCAAPAT